MAPTDLARRPDYIVIGAQKSGTSWLHRELGAHPNLFMSTPKELHFFDSWSPRWRPTRRRLRKYFRHFAAAPASAPSGETTPAYLCNPATPGRLHAAFPRVQMIAILRDPAERAYSQWRMLASHGFRQAELGFLNAFHSDLPTKGSMRSRGRYAEQLERYQALFSADQLLVLLYDDLVAEPAALLRKTYTFLGVDENFLSDTYLEPHMTSYADYHGVPSQLSTAERQEVVEYYRPSVEQLEVLLERDLNSWKAP